MPHWTMRLVGSRAVLINSTRATVAAVGSMLVARLFHMPEFYWAPISAIVILLSTINPLSLAWQRFVGTALGAAVGAIIANFFHPSWMVYGAGIFLCGILSAHLRIGTAYRFAAITLSIVLLIPHTRSPWIVAVHRFVEVSIGIAVALLVTAVWPVPKPTP
ncbi:MAG: FUSC family protein [Candidatus Sulfotelmatobacter sp.]